MTRGPRYEAAWWRPTSEHDAIREFATAREAFAWLRAQAGKPVEGSIIRRRGADGWRVVGSWPGVPPEDWRPPAGASSWHEAPPQDVPRRTLDPPLRERRSEALDAALGIRRP